MQQYSQQPQPYYTGNATAYQTGSQGTQQQPLIMAQPSSTGGGAAAASKAANKATGYGGSEVGALIGKFYYIYFFVKTNSLSYGNTLERDKNWQIVVKIQTLHISYF